MSKCEERNTHWDQPLALCFDSETFAGWFGLPKDDALPATFSIDYIRTWKREVRQTESGPKTSPASACALARGSTRLMRPNRTPLKSRRSKSNRPGKALFLSVPVERCLQSSDHRWEALRDQGAAWARSDASAQ